MNVNNAVSQHCNVDREKVWGICKKFPPDQKRNTSGVIYVAFGEKTKNCLKNPELSSKEFQHYVKKNSGYLKYHERCFGNIPRSESDKEVIWYT